MIEISKLEKTFEQPGGDALRRWIDDMPNEQYQALFGQGPAEVRKTFLDGAPQDVQDSCRGWDDDTLLAVLDRGGIHHESAWARRLPDALRFLLGRASATSR